MLNVTGLNQYYGESHILWDVNIHLPEGQCLCLIGRNGVGKTSLLKSIMGLLPIRTGSIVYDQKEFAKLPIEMRARSGIAYVPQGREIFPYLTVEENLRLGLLARRDKLRVVPERVYALFPVLKDMLHRRGGDLSGGQQQQLAIARALVIDPKLIILDEPCEGIQPNIVNQIGDIIQKLNREEGITILLVEQKLPFARRVGHQFSLMEKGRIVAEGKIDQLSNELIDQYLAI